MPTLQDTRLFKTDAYVNGAWVRGAAGKRFALYNPSTGKHLADIADLGAEDVAAAINDAHRALPAWSARSARAESRTI